MPSPADPNSNATGTPEFESWGRYPEYNATLKPLYWQGDFPGVLDGVHNGALAVGLGRSYGDVCLLDGGTLLPTTAMNRLIDFDPETGLLTAEAGITLAQADCLIAAAAVSIGVPLATGNPKHFPMSELSVEHWLVGE